MIRILTRIGPWVFTAAFAWYLTGNYFINKLDSASLKAAKSEHKNIQAIELLGASTAFIRLQGKDFYYSGIDIVLDSTVAQATLTNNNINLVVSTAIMDGKLDIALDRIDSRHQRYGGDDVILRLPTSITTLKLIGGIRSEISGQILDTHTLAIEILDCESAVTLHNLTIERLSLIANVSPPNEEYCNSEFRFDDNINIKQLVVNMSLGELSYSQEKAPDEILLTLSDSVSITAKVPFLKTAQFSR